MFWEHVDENFLFDSTVTRTIIAGTFTFDQATGIARTNNTTMSDVRDEVSHSFAPLKVFQSDDR